MTTSRPADQTILSAEIVFPFNSKMVNEPTDQLVISADIVSDVVVGTVTESESHALANELGREDRSSARSAELASEPGQAELAHSTPVSAVVASPVIKSSIERPPLNSQQGLARLEDPACPRCKDMSELEDELKLCPKCRKLRPLGDDYQIDPASFQWAQDGQAMAKLRSIGALNRLAKKVSDQVGRRWIESTFNGVRLSEKQMPHVYLVAVEAARRLGLKRMPDIYVSGSCPWDAMTFGTDENAFVVIGSALVTSFRGRELGFLFAREMGHIVAGHALWKTVIRFLVGEQNPRSGLMKGGVVGLLDPGKWIEGAIEVPLMNWARQSEITADRAGLLAIGDMETARRVLLSWSLRSPMLYPQINVEAWLEQQVDDMDDEGLRLGEMVSSPTPYISRRLSLLDDYRNSEMLKLGWNQIQQHLKAASPAQQKPKHIDSKAVRSVDSRSEPKHLEQEFGDDATAGFSSHCTECETAILVPGKVFKNRERVGICCPNPNCDKRFVVTKEQALRQSQEHASMSAALD